MLKRFSKIFSSILKKAYQRKIKCLSTCFGSPEIWTLEIVKKNKPVFPREFFNVKTRFLIPIHMQMLTSLFINLLLVPLDLVIIVRKLFAAFWLKNSFVLESWKYQFSLAISLHGLKYSYYSRYSSLLFPFYSAFMNQILISES